jgi:hypothetical protein
MIAGFLGLVALVMSFPGGSPVYADALEAESSALPILAPDAAANGVESLDQFHCVLYSDGADNCIVNVQPADVATEEAPAIRFVDAIAVVVVQTVTIAAPGLDAGDRGETAYTRPVPATEPVSDVDVKTTTGALLPPAVQSADAIVVAIIQSATIAVPGQSATDSEETPQAQSMSGPPGPLSIRQAKMTALDDEE